MVTRSALIYLSRQEGLKDFAARFRPFKKLTTRFIAGENIDEAVAAIRELNAEQCSASFDHLNESVANPAEAEDVSSLEEERSLLGKERLECGKIDYRRIDLDLPEVGIYRRGEREPGWKSIAKIGAHRRSEVVGLEKWIC